MEGRGAAYRGSYIKFAVLKPCSKIFNYYISRVYAPNFKVERREV